MPGWLSGSAVLVGISAGAIQLGLHGWKDTENWDNGFFDGLKLAPFLVDVHDEPEWQRLSESVEKLGNPMRGIGIPSGGGLRLHEDKTIEQIRKSLSEFALFDNGLK